VSMLKDGQYPLPTKSDGFPGRLREALESYGPASAVAKAIGRSDGAVRKWLRGESEPTVSDLRAICEITLVNVEWLVTGRGNKQGVTSIGETPKPPYQGVPPLNYDLMDEVIAAVGLEADIGGQPVTAQKCSSILTTVYNMSCATQQVDPENARRVIALAR
jgi:transcriptional regulator with XRE-family HTH domain